MLDALETLLNIPGDPAARLLFGDDEVLGQLDGRGMEDIQRLITIAPVNVRKTLPEQPRALQTFPTPGPSRRRQQGHFFMAVMNTLQTSFRSWIVISGIVSEMRAGTSHRSSGSLPVARTQRRSTAPPRRGSRDSVSPVA